MKFKEREIKELTEDVVLKAYNNRQQLAKISPCEEAETGRLFTGQGVDGFFDSISDEDKKRMTLLITDITTIAISNGKTFKKNSLADRENWRWVQTHPYISLSGDKDNRSSRYAIFYVENRKLDAERRVSSTKMRDKARYLIQYDLSEEQLLKIARAIGHPSPQAFSMMELQDYLLAQCDTIAAAIVEAANPANAESSAVKVTFHELLRYRVIEKFKGGVYKFNGAEGTFVGHNELKVQEFLQNPKNVEIVAAILAVLDDKKAVLGVTN